MDLISESQLVGWLSLAQKRVMLYFKIFIYQQFGVEICIKYWSKNVMPLITSHWVSHQSIVQAWRELININGTSDQDEQAGDQEWWYSYFKV